MNDLKLAKYVFIHPHDFNYIIKNYQQSFKEVVDRAFKQPAKLNLDIRHFDY